MVTEERKHAELAELERQAAEEVRMADIKLLCLNITEERKHAELAELDRQAAEEARMAYITLLA